MTETQLLSKRYRHIREQVPGFRYGLTMTAMGNVVNVS